MKSHYLFLLPFLFLSMNPKLDMKDSNDNTFRLLLVDLNSEYILQKKTEPTQIWPYSWINYSSGHYKVENDVVKFTPVKKINAETKFLMILDSFQKTNEWDTTLTFDADTNNFPFWIKTDSLIYFLSSSDDLKMIKFKNGETVHLIKNGAKTMSFVYLSNVKYVVKTFQFPKRKYPVEFIENLYDGSYFYGLMEEDNIRVNIDSLLVNFTMISDSIDTKYYLGKVEGE